MAGALVNVPPRARRGEIVEIKTLVSHAMETGYRRSQLGAPIPRDIIRQSRGLPIDVTIDCLAGMRGSSISGST